MIRVIATVHVAEGRREEILEIFHEIIPVTRQEAGCQQYQLHVNTANPYELCMIEEWASHAHLDAHLSAPHMQAAFPRLIACCKTPPSIERYTLVA